MDASLFLERPFDGVSGDFILLRLLSFAGVDADFFSIVSTGGISGLALARRSGTENGVIDVLSLCFGVFGRLICRVGAGDSLRTRRREDVEARPVVEGMGLAGSDSREVFRRRFGPVLARREREDPSWSF